ncbi:MAG: hypothetical protein JJE47_03515 [Acidimicrobiia bacterium]|nr:hypothetical protein [Acidimicrobiia bacterium]
MTTDDTPPPSLDHLSIPELIELGRPDPLIRRVDALAGRRDWSEMIDLRDRCHEAVERGKQLWGVAHHVDYRLALEADPDIAAAVVDSLASRFTLGPLTEVAAASHSWNELAPFLPVGPSRDIVGYERALRGDPPADANPVLEIPVSLSSWEPEYALPKYKSDRVEADPPAVEPGEIVELGAPGEVITDLETTEALAHLAATWTEHSNGTAEALAVEGTAASAIAALGLKQAEMTEIRLDQAMALMAWTASGGGAHGQRTGGASGRFAAWWALACLTEFTDEWPPNPDELGAAGAELRWYWWSDLYPTTGWACRIAVEDPQAGYAWVLNAADAA